MSPALLTDAVTGDAARAVRLTLFWGLEAVALRTVGGGRVPNVAEAPLRRRLDEADLPVAALDPGLFEGAAGSRAVWLNDLAALTDLAPFARRVGCDLVRLGALADPDGWDAEASAEALRQAGERAQGLGLRLAVRNEAGTAVATGAALAGLLGAVGHPAVGADWRPADALQGGEEPAEGLAALLALGAPFCVGVRDGEPGAEWDEAVVGEGAVGWGAQLAALVEAGADGPLILDAAPHPARSTGLASATALVGALRAARRAASG